MSWGYSDDDADVETNTDVAWGGEEAQETTEQIEWGGRSNRNKKTAAEKMWGDQDHNETQSANFWTSSDPEITNLETTTTQLPHSTESEYALAAVRIQSIQRGKRERSKVRNVRLNQEQNKAAQTIQKRQRQRMSVQKKRDERAARIKERSKAVERIHAIQRGNNDRLRTRLDRKDRKLKFKVRYLILGLRL